MKTLNFIKKKLQPICDPVNFDNLLRTPILKNNCERQLLYAVSHFGENDENKHIYVYIV